MNIKTQTCTLLISIVVLVIVLFFLLTYVFTSLGAKNIPTLLLEKILLAGTIIILPLLNLLYFKRLSRIKGLEANEEGKESTKLYVDHLYNEIRGKIHDYNNHLQVLYGLLLKEDRCDAEKYMAELMEDVISDYEVLNTNQPAIDSLLHYKKGIAESRGIETDIYISTDLSNFNIKTSEFCRALGNIINNSIEVLAPLKGEKDLIIIIRKENGFIFEVINNGPPIPQEALDTLFSPGFTTKKSGQGLGLYTAHQITERLGGKISVDSNSVETTFKIYFPSKEVNYTLTEERELLLTAH